MYFRAVKLNLRNKLNVFNIIYHISTNLPNLTLLLFLLKLFYKLLEIMWLIQRLFDSIDSYSF